MAIDSQLETSIELGGFPAGLWIPMESGAFFGCFGFQLGHLGTPKMETRLHPDPRGPVTSVRKAPGPLQGLLEEKASLRCVFWHTLLIFLR